MKLFKCRILMLLTGVLLFNSGVISQNLVVTLNNSDTEAFSISNIQSIKFENSSMVMKAMDGTQTSWDIDNIDNYAFQQTTSLDESVTDSSDDISIFPNPAPDHVTIAFKSQISGTVTIDIIDTNGKHIQQVHHGNRLGEFQFPWNPEVQSGMYYCRITTDNKTVIKPIIIL